MSATESGAGERDAATLRTVAAELVRRDLTNMAGMLERVAARITGATPDADDASEHRPNACCDFHRHIADGCCHCGDPAPAASTDASGALSETDVEALAWMIHRASGCGLYSTPDGISDDVCPPDREDYDAAQAILVSDWLAARESAAATRARAEVWAWVERLASEWDLTEFPDERTATILRADLRRLIEAARIARGDA